MEAKVVLIIL